MTSRIIGFRLNGRNTEIIAQPLETLQTVLRQQLNRTATKSGCNQGGCGSCTVLVNGEPMVSCMLPVADVAGADIVTLEGLGDNDGLHPLQQAFFEDYAIQCGYCSPGMIMTAKALLDRNPRPSRSEIADAISGNICRCTGYVPILDAIEDAARRLNGGDA